MKHTKQVEIFTNEPVISHFFNVQDGNFVFTAVISDGWDKIPDYENDSQKVIYSRPLSVCRVVFDSGIKLREHKTEEFLSSDQITLLQAFFNEEYMTDINNDCLQELENVVNQKESPTTIGGHPYAYGALLFASDMDEIIAKVGDVTMIGHWQKGKYFVEKWDFEAKRR